MAKKKASRKSSPEFWKKNYPILDGNKKKKEKGDKELEESEHDCDEVHPDKSHDEWKEGKDEHDKNSAAEGPHGEAMSAAEYRKKGIYVTDANHPEKGGNVSKSDPLNLGKNWVHYTPEEKQKQRDKSKDGKQGEFKESAHMVGFIKSLTEKNYAEANKYLQAALEVKMKQRISTAAKNIGF